MMPMASRMNGKASWASATVMMTASTRPPAKPARMPSADPSRPPTTTAEKPITSDTLRAVDHAREHVAPEMIGAEQMRSPVGPLERGRRQPAAQRLADRVLRREPRRRRRDDAEQRDEQDPRDRQPGHAAPVDAQPRRPHAAGAPTSVGADAGIEEAIDQVDEEVDDDEHQRRRGTPCTAPPGSRGCRWTGWRAGRCRATRTRSPSPRRRRAACRTAAR